VASGSSNAFAIAGGVVAAGAIGAAAVWFAPPQTQSGAEPQAAAVVTTQTAPEPTVVDAAPTIAAVPTIDTFFRSPDDTTVIAGQAEPGQAVAIVLGGDVIETVTAGSDGAFGTVLFIAASDQPRRLRLIADPDGTAIPSNESIIVPPAEIAVAAVAPAPSEPDAPEDVIELAVEATTSAAPEISTTTPDQIAVASDVASGATPQSDAAPAIAAAADTPRTAAPAPPTLIADAQGVRILQPGVGETPAQPTLTPNIALDSITYDPDGEVLLAGRGANSGGFVRIYLDNEPITASRISVGGDWRTDLPEVDTGIYTLRVDEVDAEGVVQSRVETPFKKEEPADVAAILAEETSAEGFDIAVKTVQPGATLWAIAEEQWGDGVLYVSVFEANRDLIRDPDLIYPGQVFRIPRAAQ
jgi:nucleoid-associated protein YgaU